MLIADPSPMIRTGLRGALFSVGFRTINETQSFIKLHDLIEQDAIDLLITSSELESNDVGYLVTEMRNHRLGTNPFVVVICLLANAEPDYVKRVIDSGYDDLLLMPVQPDQLIMRIEKLTRVRKPFVVTHDYTGPDRRSKPRAYDTPSAPLLEVPNPLRFRAENPGMNSTRLQRAVTESAANLDRIKIERLAVQIDWLVSHVHATIRDGVAADPTALAPYTGKLSIVAEDLLHRLQGTTAELHAAPVSELLEIAKRLEIDPALVPFAQMERLTTLSRTIGKSLGAPAAVAQTRAPCAPEPVAGPMMRTVAVVT
ncbi:MAG TPA: response regulator [Magnetospirillum sp.]|nr:response regulator [Magnetospirillum sp.]